MKVITTDLPQFEEIELYVLADSHEGDAYVDRRRVKQLIEEVRAEPNRFVIVNGDVANMAIKDSVSDSYEEKVTPNEAIDNIVEMLYPIADRILVITEGNHEERVGRKDGILVMYQVAKRLFGENIANKYSRGAYLLFVAFGKNNGRDDRSTVYSIYGKHGAGGGKRIGGKANRLEDMMSIVDADIYIHSHTHTPLSFRLGFFRVDYRNRKTTFVEKLFVNSNAFLLYGGYGENAGYNVASTKYPKIILRGNKRDAEAVI